MVLKYSSRILKNVDSIVSLKSKSDPISRVAFFLRHIGRCDGENLEAAWNNTGNVVGHRKGSECRAGLS